MLETAPWDGKSCERFPIFRSEKPLDLEAEHEGEAAEDWRAPRAQSLDLERVGRWALGKSGRRMIELFTSAFGRNSVRTQ